ncbi:MAG: hypothetical protein ABSF50_07650 [Burkholderiaceae bacterium]|jgi:hypothetical protein
MTRRLRSWDRAGALFLISVLLLVGANVAARSRTLPAAQAPISGKALRAAHAGTLPGPGRVRASSAFPVMPAGSHLGSLAGEYTNRKRGLAKGINGHY